VPTNSEHSIQRFVCFVRVFAVFIVKLNSELVNFDGLIQNTAPFEQDAFALPLLNLAGGQINATNQHRARRG
jgi:hypothetical protein